MRSNEENSNRVISVENSNMKLLDLLALGKLSDLNNFYIKFNEFKFNHNLFSLNVRLEIVRPKL